MFDNIYKHNTTLENISPPHVLFKNNKIHLSNKSKLINK